MARDRSLDEFFGGDGDADAESAADGADTDADAGVAGAEGADAGTSDGDDAETPLTDASAVDPATPTYRWTPEGAACESCGRAVERRWEDDGAFVCDDCKEW